MTISYERLLDRGRGRAKKLLAISAIALIASVALATPSWAAVNPGNNISVFHELDIVSASGHEDGDPLTIEVKRNGIVIGQTSGPAVIGPEGTGLEVNHEGTGPDDGSCWSGITPDVLPGDEIVVTNNADPNNPVIDSTIVLDVSILEGPFEVTADDPAAGLQAGDIVIEGVAADADGTRLPLAELSSGMRDRAVGEFRAEPNYIEYKDATTTEWRAVYRIVNGAYPNADNRGSLTLAQQRQALLNPSVGHELAWESQDLTVTMVSEGPNQGGPGVGCNAPKAANAVTSFDDKFVNVGGPAPGDESGSLVVSGTAMNNAQVTTESVVASLSDGTNTIEAQADLNGTTWTATFEREAIDTLADGTLTAAGAYNVTGGTAPLTGATKTILKDTVNPGSTSATPPGGTFNSAQTVTLDAEDGANIRYTTNGNDPTATSNPYNGQIRVSSSQTIKARTFDAAGNFSDVAAFEYTIDGVAPTLGANLNSGSYNVARILQFTSNKPGAKIHYTTNGDVPDAGDTEYTGPITVSKSQSFKAVAIDPAGNASRVLERDIVIRTTSRTTLNVATTNLKLGKSRVIRGAVRPVQDSGRVRLIVKHNGVQVLARNLALTDSKYRFAYKPKAVGRYSVQVRFAQDVDNRASKSVVKSFRVVR